MFLTDVEASFLYTITIGDRGEIYYYQFGRARLIEGRWKITRAIAKTSSTSAGIADRSDGCYITMTLPAPVDGRTTVIGADRRDRLGR